MNEQNNCLTKYAVLLRKQNCSSLQPNSVFSDLTISLFTFITLLQTRMGASHCKSPHLVRFPEITWSGGGERSMSFHVKCRWEASMTCTGYDLLTAALASTSSHLTYFFCHPISFFVFFFFLLAFHQLLSNPLLIFF